MELVLDGPRESVRCHCRVASLLVHSKTMNICLQRGSFYLSGYIWLQVAENPNPTGLSLGKCLLVSDKERVGIELALGTSNLYFIIRTPALFFCLLGLTSY